MTAPPQLLIATVIVDINATSFPAMVVNIGASPTYLYMWAVQ